MLHVLQIVRPGTLFFKVEPRGTSRRFQVGTAVDIYTRPETILNTLVHTKNLVPTSNILTTSTYYLVPKVLVSIISNYSRAPKPYLWHFDSFITTQMSLTARYISSANKSWGCRHGWRTSDRLTLTKCKQLHEYYIQNVCRMLGIKTASGRERTKLSNNDASKSRVWSGTPPWCSRPRFRLAGPSMFALEHVQCDLTDGWLVLPVVSKRVALENWNLTKFSSFNLG